MYSTSTLAKKLDADNDQTFETLVGTWALGLAGLQRADIERGLQAIMKSGDTFPPSLPEFRALCKQPPTMHREYRAIPDISPTGAHDAYRALPKRLKDDLMRLQLEPKPGEHKHAWAARCREYALNNLRSALPDSVKQEQEAGSYLDAYGRFIRGTAP